MTRVFVTIYVIWTCIFCSPAGAVDFSVPILDDNDKPICTLRRVEEATPQAPARAGEQFLPPDGICPPDKVLTLGLAARNALYSTFDDEHNLPGEQRAERGDLARSIRAAVPGDFEFKKVEDKALIKRLIGKAYGPLIVSAAWRLLDPPPAEKGGK